VADHWTASEEVIFQHPDGTRTPGLIAIGAPEPTGDDWGCRFALDGLDKRMAGPIFGITALQALLLAIRLIGYRLHDFRQKGGQVLEPDGVGHVDLEMLFGPLLCDPATR
jgi:hypothetical protein